jgi:hypothetical protein
MSSASDYMVKKSCLDQLSLILFDLSSKRGKLLFKNQMSAGPSDLFAFLITEINNTYNTAVAYLKG